jgi:hypothetical protein
MWWEPRTDNEVRVRREVERLADRMQSHEHPARLVYGVGSISWRGQPAPLLIVDGALDPRRRNRARVGGVGVAFSRALYALAGPLWPLSYPFVRDQTSQRITALDLLLRAAALVFLPDTPRPREWMFGSALDAGSDFLLEFQSWSLPRDLVVLFSRPPKALAAAGVAPLDATKFGTIGLVGIVNGQSPGYTTAGHVVDGPYALVCRARRVLGRIFPFGDRENIVLYADPQNGREGYDLAIASSENCGPARTFEAEGAAIANPGAVRRFAVCHLNGAVSGSRWGFVDATLGKCEDDKQRRQWSNCWAVTGQSGWFCKEGDSGSVVELKKNEDDNGTILGILVGGLSSGGWFLGSRMEIGFVQDLRSTIEFARKTYGCDIRLF